MASGVFGLKKVYKRQYQNVIDKNFASWSESATYGYYGAGTTGVNISTINRLDLFTEVLATPSSKLKTNSYLATTISPFYGYFTGGLNSPIVYSSTDRLDFSTEVVTAPTFLLSIARRSLSGASTNSYGYYAGGIASINYSTIDRLDFLNETISTPSSKLSGEINFLTSISNNSYAYFGGGATAAPAVISTIDRLDFSTETIATPPQKLSISRAGAQGVENNSYGYFAGGILFSSAYYSTIDRLEFSTELITTPSLTLPQTNYQLSATSNSSYGYFGGGYSPPYLSSVNRLNFSSETISLTTTFTQSIAGLVGASGGQSILRGNKSYGYYAGGAAVIPGPFFATYSSIFRLNFSNETFTSLNNNLSDSNYLHDAASNNLYSYIAGGRGGGLPITNINRLDFSNETVVDRPSIRLPVARRTVTATSSSSYSYFAGGEDVNINPLSSIDRLDFYTENCLTIPTRLSSVRYGITTIENNNYSYFGAGRDTFSVFSNIERLDFSTETKNSVSPLNPQIFSSAGSSNNIYGYFGGGSTANTGGRVSNIQRLEFSSETVSLITSKLAQSRSEVAAFSSATYGYFGGGYNPTPTPVYFSTVDRLDFFTESVSNSFNLPQSRYAMAGSSNSN